MAEYYHIWHYEKFSPGYLATLLSGLREESRVQMARSGQKAKLENILLATMADELNVLIHGKVEQSLLEILVYGKKEEEKMCKGFSSKESFAEWWLSH